MRFENDLAWRILGDTGMEPGALALMAYTLDELYQSCCKDNREVLSYEGYNDLGGVQGAIGTRAEKTFTQLDEEVRAALPLVFRELVEVDERGMVTRQRAFRSRFEENNAASRLLKAFTDARLLTTGGNDDKATVEVGHEAVFRSWPRLARWIETVQDDLYLLRQVRLAAQEWEHENRQDDFLWHGVRLQEAQGMVKRLQPELDDVTRNFLCPESERLLDLFRQKGTSKAQRESAKEQLIQLKDLPVLFASLKDEIAEVRQAATYVLSKVGDASATEPLVSMLHDEQPEVRRNTVIALGATRDLKSLDFLIVALNDTDHVVRYNAVQALGMMGSSRAVDFLIPLLEDKKNVVRRTTVKALGQIGDEVALQPLVNLLQETSFIRDYVVEAFAKIGGTTAVELLLKALENRNPRIRRGAAETLGKIGSPLAVEPLATALHDKDRWVRKEAAVALENIGTPEAKEALSKGNVW